MKYKFVLDDEPIELEAQVSKDSISLDFGSGNHTFEITNLGRNDFLLRQNGRNERITFLKVQDDIYVITDNESYTFKIPSSKDADSFGEEQGEHGDKSKIRAPMPGKVVKIMVQPGDKIEPKQKLVIVEAMKMENPLIAPFRAEVTKVNCVAGELVDVDKILIELKPLQ